MLGYEIYGVPCLQGNRESLGRGTFRLSRKCPHFYDWMNKTYMKLDEYCDET